MKGTGTNKWLHLFALATVLFSMPLIFMGGLVTSKGVGLAVPDYPTSFGYNMFLLPLDQWVGSFGIHEEHSHRLMGSLVGLLILILVVWLWRVEPTGKYRRLVLGIVFLGPCIMALMVLTGIRSDTLMIIAAGVAGAVAVFSFAKILKNLGAVHWWGTMALCIVTVLGVLGGLRVVKVDDRIGIFHGTLAQLLLAVLACIALFTSNWWQSRQTTDNPEDLVPRPVRLYFLIATIFIFLQLVLGATMRHQHAGLPVWDFPMAHGKWWPSTDQASLARYNQERNALQVKLYKAMKATDSRGNPVTFLVTPKGALQKIRSVDINLHMLHRLVAILILGLVLGAVLLMYRKLGIRHALTRIALGWLGLILLQGVLGALTVLKYKPADIATAHVLCGAFTLLTGVIGTLISYTKHLPAMTERGDEGFTMSRAEALG